MRGQVDGLGAGHGLTGWAVDPRSPDQPVTLELLVGDKVVARTRTALFRPDILWNGHGLRAGFAFAASTFGAVLDLAPALRRGSVAVRIAGTDQTLPGLPDATGDDLLGLAREMLALVGVPEVLPSRLLASLVDLERNARFAGDGALPRGSGGGDGTIEFVAPLDRDHFLIGGWTRREMPLDHSAILVAGRRYAAGLRGLSYPRPDLPAGGRGFLALVRSAWPPAVFEDLVIQSVSDPDFTLRGLNPLRLESPERAAGLLGTCRGQADGERLDALTRALSLIDGWAALEAPPDDPVDLGIDRVLVLPGFGAFVEGWMLSARLAREDMALRFGDRVLLHDARALAVKPRPDLAAITSAPDDLARAGFVALFRGDVGDADLHRPLLKLKLSDGSVRVRPLPARAIRVFRGPADLALLQDLAPSLAGEAYRDELVRACGRTVRALERRVVPVQVEPARQAVVAALPPRPEDLALMLDQVRNHFPRLSADLGLVLLFDPRHGRSQVIEAARDLRRAVVGKVSLLAVEDTACALPWLPGLLRQTQAENFVYMAGDVLLNEAGWDRVLIRFATEETGLALFGFDDGGRRGAEATWTSRCFAWNRGEFEAWLARSPVLLGVAHRDNGLALEPASTRHADTLTPLTPPPPLPGVERCDDAILDAYRDQFGRTDSET